VAVATESTYGMWRIKTALPFSKILTSKIIAVLIGCCRHEK
jgi:hypothetical protein